MEKTLKPGGKEDSVTASTALLNQKFATLNIHRMLSPSEIDLLRQSEQEIAERYKTTRVQVVARSQAIA